MGRIENIKSYAVQKQREENDAAIRKKNLYAYYIAEINKLGDRIVELVDTANACIEARIPLDNSWGTRESYETNFYISNGWSHLTGFIGDIHRNITGVGKIGGGACHFNVKVDKNGNVYEATGSDVNWALKKFLEEFDTFETKFYEYVDKKVGNGD